MTTAKEAQERSRRLRELLEAIPDAVVVYGMDGNVLCANHLFVETYGWSQDELMGWDIDLVPAGEPKPTPQTMTGTLHGRKALTETKRLTKDGRLVACRISSSILRGWNGAEDAVIEIHRDISELKHARQELRQLRQELEELVALRTCELHESEARYRLLLDSSPDPIAVYDDRGKITYLNPAFEQTFGWTLAELAGQGIDFVPAHEAEITRQAVIRTLEGENVLLETQRLTKAGRLLDIQLKTAIFRDPQGKLAGDIVIYRDISDLKRSQRQLKKAKEAAEAASRAKSAFLANMSHEIRTPMNGVIGMTDLLLATPLDAEQLDFAQTVKTSAAALMHVINDILDFSKIEAGKMELEELDFDLRLTVEDVAAIVAPKAQGKGLEFGYVLEPQVPAWLRGDPGRLRQILINLLNNAIKFTEKGQVDLRVDLEGETDRQAMLRFAISDTGIGIPAERRERLFKSFSQLDASITRRYGGTGLGLAICQRLVKMLGGQIGVESLKPHGSTFWFTVRMVHLVGHRPPAPEETADLNGVKVLVVEDNPVNLQLLHQDLHACGCVCQSAANADQAMVMLRKLAAGRPAFDLAIIDNILPDMDGEKLGRRIKNVSALAKIPLIMLTACGQPGNGARMREAGFAAYLTKPIKRSQLIQALKEVLGRTSAKSPGQWAPLVTRHTVMESAKGNWSILLAEDNAINCKLALNLLNKFGCQAKAVGNGRDVLRALAAEPFDLILMDVQMPEMDGFEATAAIRRDESVKGGHVPIIALTAHALKGDRERCIQQGMDDYLTKPIDPRRLYEVICKYLPKP